MEAYAINPRRRRRRVSRRRRSFSAPAVRRRRRNPGVLRIANPRRRRSGGGGGGGIMDLLMPAAMVSLGAIAGTVLPRTIKLLKPETTKQQAALYAIGTAVALNMVGKRFLGPANARNLAIGAASSGISTFLNQVLPENMRLSGIGQSEIVTEADIDAEIRKLAAGGIMAGGVGDVFPDVVSSFSGVGTAEIDDIMSTMP